MFFNRSVDSIIASITKQVDQLHDAVARHHAEHLEHVAAAAVSSQKSEVAKSERDRAASIALRLEALVK